MLELNAFFLNVNYLVFSITYYFYLIFKSNRPLLAEILGNNCYINFIFSYAPSGCY